MTIQIETTELSGVVMITPNRYSDGRGWFSETWNAEAMKSAGLGLEWVQDNHSYSAAKGTLRGLHFQRPPHAQDKLVRCPRGRILDVAVDARRGSVNYGRWTARVLSAELGNQLFIPKGFLHGFITLTENSEVQYKCSDYYAPDFDGTVRWDDPELQIGWLLDGNIPQLSEKDANAPYFRDFENPFEVGRRA